MLRPAAAPSPEAAIVPKTTLSVELRPLRAGTNLTGAAVEYDIVVTNTGETPLHAVRLDARLTSAGARQDATISALYAETIERPLVAPFDLPAGQTVSLGGKAMLPHAMLAPMSAGGRSLFVPLMTVNLRYTGAVGDGQTARAFLIGIARGEGSKMAPFRIDQARMYDTVAALPYPMVIDA